MEKHDDGSYPDGYETELITGKMGKRAVWQPDVRLRDVRVPAANKLAGANSFKDVNTVLTATRGGAAWECLGHAVAAYESAVQLCRRSASSSAGRSRASSWCSPRWPGMLAEVTAMQLICFRVAELQTQGRLTGPMASMAKMHNARKARAVCAEARDILGGNGLLLEYHVARHLTDMEVVHTYEGTDSIQSLILGREITGLSAFT